MNIYTHSQNLCYNYKTKTAKNNAFVAMFTNIASSAMNHNGRPQQNIIFFFLGNLIFVDVSCELNMNHFYWFNYYSGL